MLLLIPVKFEKWRGSGNNVIPGNRFNYAGNKVGNNSIRKYFASMCRPMNLEISVILTIMFAASYTSVI